MPPDPWPQLSVADVAEHGIPAWPGDELPEFNAAAVARWQLGDFAAAMWLSWNPDDRALPRVHEIACDSRADGQWTSCGEPALAIAPGDLSWRPTKAVEWTATAQVLRGSSTLWVIGGIARDSRIEADIRQGGSQWTAQPDAQSDCFLIGIEVPPVATVAANSSPLRTLGHWSGRAT